MTNKHTDPFLVLGLSPTANLLDVKKAFRKLALEFHPDREAFFLRRTLLTEKMKQLNLSYAEAKRLVELREKSNFINNESPLESQTSDKNTSKEWIDYYLDFYPYFSLIVSILVAFLVPTNIAYNELIYRTVVFLFSLWALYFVFPLVILLIGVVLVLPIFTFGFAFKEAYSNSKQGLSADMSFIDLTKEFIKRFLLFLLSLACFPLFNYIGFNGDLPSIALIFFIGNTAGELFGFFYWIFVTRKHEETFNENLRETSTIVEN